MDFEYDLPPLPTLDNSKQDTQLVSQNRGLSSLSRGKNNEPLHPLNPNLPKDEPLDLLDGAPLKRKRTIAKIDADRLMSENGLPKLKHQAPRLKFKGKGKEHKDLRKLLEFYQLWAHGMFPKANFRDAIKAIERVCHERRMRVVLQSWKDEQKIKETSAEIHSDDDDDIVGDSLFEPAVRPIQEDDDDGKMTEFFEKLNAKRSKPSKPLFEKNENGKEETPLSISNSRSFASIFATESDNDDNVMKDISETYSDNDNPFTFKDEKESTPKRVLSHFNSNSSISPSHLFDDLIPSISRNHNSFMSPKSIPLNENISHDDEMDALRELEP